jgi:hypothetical protein
MNRIGITLVIAIFGHATAFGGGTLQIGDLIVEGNQVVVPVMLGGTPETRVAAMDFRLVYDPGQLQPVVAEPGVAAATADKRIMANMNAPGEYVVVMMGMNQTTCPFGEVVRVLMGRAQDGPAGNWSLGIAQATLSTLDGTVIPCEVLPYAGGAIQVDAPATTPPATVRPARPQTVHNTAPAASKPSGTARELTAPVETGYGPTAQQGLARSGKPLKAGQGQGNRAKPSAADAAKAREVLAKRSVNDATPGETLKPGTTRPGQENGNDRAPGNTARGSDTIGSARAPNETALAKVAPGAQTVERDTLRASETVSSVPAGGTETSVRPKSLLVAAAIVCLVMAGGGGLLVLRRKLLN